MNIWIGDLFQCGHTIEYLMDMCYWNFIYLTQVIVQERQVKSGSKSSGSRNLRPVQKDAISKRKNM